MLHLFGVRLPHPALNKPAGTFLNLFINLYILHYFCVVTNSWVCACKSSVPCWITSSASTMRRKKKKKKKKNKKKNKKNKKKQKKKKQKTSGRYKWIFLTCLLVLTPLVWISQWGKKNKGIYLLLIERKLKTHPHPHVTKEDHKARERW